MVIHQLNCFNLKQLKEKINIFRIIPFNIKNKLRGRVAELVNSRNHTSWKKLKIY